MPWRNLGPPEALVGTLAHTALAAVRPYRFSILRSGTNQIAATTT